MVSILLISNSSGLFSKSFLETVQNGPVTIVITVILVFYNIFLVFWNTATRVQIQDKTDCISYSTNTLGKGMNPIILPPARGK